MVLARGYRTLDNQHGSIFLDKYFTQKDVSKAEIDGRRRRWGSSMQVTSAQVETQGEVGCRAGDGKSSPLTRQTSTEQSYVIGWEVLPALVPAPSSTS